MIGRRDASSAGQVLEFRVWAELIAGSGGALHVFLPLLDRGIDGVVHRLTDGAYLPVQVKGRAALREGTMMLTIPEESLVDDRAWLIAGLSLRDEIGPEVLVVPVGEFRSRSTLEVFRGRRLRVAEFSMHPTAQSRWKEFIVPRERIAEPLMAGAASAEPVVGAEPSERTHSWLGFLGEAEVVRRLAESPRLDLFRPFPDLETVEVLARDNVGHGWCGLQVKTGSVTEKPHRMHATVRRSSYRPAPSTYVVVLAWLPDERRFHERCLFVPSERLDEVAQPDGPGWEIVFDPDGPYQTKLDPFRAELAALPELVLGACR